MKIILSRKGFDAQYGGIPSPIFDDGSMASLPIPSNQGRPCADIWIKDRSLCDLLLDLAFDGVRPIPNVHLDPDLDIDCVPRQPNWKPSFGQAGAAQAHLTNQHVGVGDIFLFFGWFRKAQLVEGRWRFIPNAPDIHSLFGWMQVGEVIGLTPDVVNNLPAWLTDHPHVVHAFRMPENNTLYVAADNLMNHGRQGAGVFQNWSPRLQLTAEGRNRSVWKLPSWMDPRRSGRELSFHRNQNRWCLDGDFTYLQSVARGQEFVMDVSGVSEAEGWLHQLFE